MSAPLAPAALIDPVARIVRAAGARILEVYRSEFEVQHKGDDSPLTAADLASHRCIIAGLAELEPRLPVLSEESREVPFSQRSTWSRFWLVDPLDGTREFVKRNGEFTVNVALIEEHRPVLGAVYVPVTDTLYLAARGLGALRQLGHGPREPIGVRAHAQRPLTVVGSRSHQSEAGLAFIRKLGTVELTSIGSSLKFCLVAEGRADIYPRFGPTCEWDTAAAQCVVEQAGGRVTDTALVPLRYNCRESLLNPHFLVYGDTSVDWREFVPES